LEISPDKIQNSRETLAQYGNMFSVTILFVLERILNDPNKMKSEPKAIYAAAYGPGVSLESAIILHH